MLLPDLIFAMCHAVFTLPTTNQGGSDEAVVPGVVEYIYLHAEIVSLLFLQVVFFCPGNLCYLHVKHK